MAVLGSRTATEPSGSSSTYRGRTHRTDRCQQRRTFRRRAAQGFRKDGRLAKEVRRHSNHLAPVSLTIRARDGSSCVPFARSNIMRDAQGSSPRCATVTLVANFARNVASFHRRLVAVDRHDVLASEEEAIVGGIGTHIPTEQGLLTRIVQILCRRSHRQDHHTGPKDLFAGHRLVVLSIGPARYSSSTPSVRTSAPKRDSCSRISTIRSGPITPSGTWKVLDLDCGHVPPKWVSSKRSGESSGPSVYGRRVYEDPNQRRSEIVPCTCQGLSECAVAPASAPP